MTTTQTRTLSTLAISALLVAGLTGCSLIPGLGGGQGTANANPDSELNGTTWAGTDSDGDSWELELQSDGTIGLGYGGNNFDDAGDTWTHTGDVVAFSLVFDDGPINMVGAYEGLDAPIEVDGTYTGGTFTLTLERQ